MSSTPLIIGVTDQDSNFFISIFALFLKRAELLLSLQLFVLLIIVMINVSIITVHYYYNQYMYVTKVKWDFTLSSTLLHTCIHNRNVLMEQII